MMPYAPKTGWTGDVPAKKNGQTNKIHLSIRFGGALSAAVEPEFIPDTAANSKHRATHGGLPQSLFHR